MKVATSLRINPVTNDQLQKLAVKRSEDGNAISSKTAIVADLVARLYKRECK